MYELSATIVATHTCRLVVQFMDWTLWLRLTCSIELWQPVIN